MPKGWYWLAKSPAVCLALFLLLFGIYFGSSRDFGSFLLSIPLLGILFVVTLIAIVWSAIIKVDKSRFTVALVIVCLTPIAYFYSYGFTQRVRFLLWAPAHYQELVAASKKNGIIMGWDSWGMAGSDTFSYLVVDTEDRLGSEARIDQWTKQISQSCGIWESRRVWPRFYIVTTNTNCPYDGVDPAN